MRTYDAAGHLLSDGTNTFSYSARGRLSQVQNGGSVTQYAYNGLGQRLMKLGATDTSLTQFVYDEHGHLIGEYDFFGRPLQETVYLGDLPIAVLTQSISADESGAVQVDNSDSGKATVVGFWASASTPTDFVGTTYQTHAPSSGSDSFTWKLTLPTVGKYFIQVRWPSDTGRATHAVFTASANGGFDTGVATRTLNQQQNNNTWVDVGVKTLGVANSTLNVKLTTTATGTVAADAVRAVPYTVTGTHVYYIFADHLNTPRLITQATDNQIVWRWDQTDPFGVLPPNENPNNIGVFKYNPRFPGQYFDAESGLHYNYHRTYDSAIGSYTSSDPIGLQGGINTYAYIGGNPVNAVEPLGLKPGDLFDTIPEAAVDALDWVYNTYPKGQNEWAGTVYRGNV